MVGVVGLCFCLVIEVVESSECYCSESRNAVEAECADASDADVV